MRLFRKCLYFFGSFYFALVIIAAMALFAVIGTFAEAKSGSHRYAALYTYDNPLFTSLLGAMFLNIALSALRRYPFGKRHLPFLITHFGLLMLIAGVIIKNLYGLQGNMRLIEGGSSARVLLPSSRAIVVEAVDEGALRKLKRREYSFDSSLLHKMRSIGEGEGDDMGDLTLEIAGYTPHSEEEWESWIKGEMCHISGLAPFPVHRVESFDLPLPISSKVVLHPSNREVWDLYALDCSDVEGAVKALLLTGTSVKAAGEAVELRCDVAVEIGDHAVKRAEMRIEKKGEQESPPLFIDLRCDHLFSKKELYIDSVPVKIATEPKIAFIRDGENEVTLAAIDSMGNLFTAFYPSKAITPLIVYNEGFGGYYAGATLPFPAYPYDPKAIAAAKEQRIARELRATLAKGVELSPPLRAVEEACKGEGADFAYALVEIYRGALSENLSRVLQAVEWSALPEEVVKASLYSALLKNRGGGASGTGSFLSKEASLSEQLLPLAGELPPIDLSQKFEPAVALEALKAAFEIYRIDLSFFEPNLSSGEVKELLVEYLKSHLFEEEIAQLIPPLKELPFNQKCRLLEEVKRSHGAVAERMGDKSAFDLLPIASLAIDVEGLSKALNGHTVALETPITPVQRALPPTTKLEELIPALTLFARDGENRQFLSLSYDPSGEAIAWPALKGKYRFRFQPKSVEIGTEIWLHDAREISYPGSGQAMSYEASIIAKEVKSGKSEEATLSMNRVYETKGGVRFYLSNITPSLESGVQRADLAVNYDPVKGILTYPGGIIIAIGSLLLFFSKRRAK